MPFLPYSLQVFQYKTIYQPLLKTKIRTTPIIIPSSSSSIRSFDHLLCSQYHSPNNNTTSSKHVHLGFSEPTGYLWALSSHALHEWRRDWCPRTIQQGKPRLPLAMQEQHGSGNADQSATHNAILYISFDLSSNPRTYLKAGNERGCNKP